MRFKFRNFRFSPWIMDACIFVVIVAAFIPKLSSPFDWIAPAVAVASAIVALIAYFARVRVNKDQDTTNRPVTRSSEGFSKIENSVFSVPRGLVALETKTFPTKKFLNSLTPVDFFWSDKPGPIGRSFLTNYQHLTTWASVSGKTKHEVSKIPQSERMRRLLVSLGTDELDERLVVTVGALKIEIAGEDAKVHLASAKNQTDQITQSVQTLSMRIPTAKAPAAN